MIRAHFFALFVLLGGVSGLGLSQTLMRMPDDSKRPAYDRVEPYFEQQKALHRTLSSTNGTVAFAEFVNAARMFSSAMTKELGIPIEHFIVISQARSGGAWLRSLLDSHPNVIMAGELFLHHVGTLESTYHQLEEKARGRRIMAIGFKLSNGLRSIPPPCLGSGSESSGMLLGISSEGSRGPLGVKFCGIWGACWGFLGASWRPLGASGGRLGASWGRLGAVSSKGRCVSSLGGSS